MYWLNMTWITENWVPLLVTLVLGFIFGWLLTGISPARRARTLEARNADLEGKQRKTELELSDSRSAYTKASASLTSAQKELEEEQAKSTSLAAQVAGFEAATKAAEEARAAEEAKAAEEAAEAAKEAEAGAEAKAAEAAQEAAEAPTEELPAVDADTDADEGATAGAPSANQAASLAAAFDHISERFATAARAPQEIQADKAREIALTEAYSRAVRLQEELDRSAALLADRDAQLNSVKAELLTSNVARHELDDRLIHAREDVAAELAVLASTMIKMKDDALARAESRNASLSAELDALRSELDVARTGQSSTSA